METSGFIALLVAAVASRILNERGYRQLTPEEKLRLMDGFSTSRSYSLLPLVVLVGTFWVFATQTNFNKQILVLGYFALLIVYVAARLIFNQRKLRELNLPLGYRRMFTAAQIVSCIGTAWFIYTLSDLSSGF